MEQIQITHIPLKDIEPSATNPRKIFDQKELDELANSIEQSGVLQPIIVRKQKKKYEVVAGERRYRAARLVLSTDKSRDTIPAIIRELTDDQVLEIQIVENLQRKDVHPMEEAVGFQNLIDVKKMEVKEVAARVGKSTAYVLQRLKLITLIEDIQKVFYAGRIKVSDALKIARLAAPDQQELYNDQMENMDMEDPYDFFELDKWTLTRYTNKLNRAAFDLADPALVASAGSCESCPFNSASNSLLFPDQASEAICNNSKCYQLKTDTSFENELQKAKEDPTIILASDRYSESPETKKLRETHHVLHSREFNIEDTPDFPEHSDFDHIEDKKERAEAYNEAKVEYYEQMEDLEQREKKGELKKAFIVDGDDKGKYVLINLLNNSSSSAEPAQPKSEIEIITEEIAGIRQRSERAQQIDENKIWEQVREYFADHSYEDDEEKYAFEFSNKPLNQVELEALARTMYNVCMDRQDKFMELSGVDPDAQDAERFTGIKAKSLNALFRIFIFENLPPYNLYNGFDPEAADCMRLAEMYWPEKIKAITESVKEAAEKREKKANARIEELEKRQADLQNFKDAKKKPKAPKKSAKKGLADLLENETN